MLVPPSPLVPLAGICPTGLLDWVDEGVSQHRLAMEVNYFGVVSLTKAALPLLKARWRNYIFEFVTFCFLNL
jgi:NAD(P)-dependent dehydrogenase (short-subunit alcohol dehydrogenase family)